MNCLYEGCVNEVVDDSNYCDDHQWNLMMEGFIEADPAEEYDSGYEDGRHGGEGETKSFDGDITNEEEFEKGYEDGKRDTAEDDT